MRSNILTILLLNVPIIYQETSSISNNYPLLIPNFVIKSNDVVLLISGEENKVPPYLSGLEAMVFWFSSPCVCGRHLQRTGSCVVARSLLDVFWLNRCTQLLWCHHVPGGWFLICCCASDVLWFVCCYSPFPRDCLNFKFLNFQCRQPYLVSKRGSTQVSAWMLGDSLLIHATCLI